MCKEELAKNILCPYGEAGTDICIGEHCKQFDNRLHRCSVVRDKKSKEEGNEKT